MALPLILTLAAPATTAFAILLEIVVYLTHRPVVEHRVIDRAVRQLDKSLVCIRNETIDVVDDVIDNKVSRQVGKFWVLQEHRPTKHHLLQGYVKILMQDEATYLGFADDAL